MQSSISYKFKCIGPHRIAGYEDIIDDAARELERVNEKLAAATLQHQRMQARVSQLEARASNYEDSTWQVRMSFEHSHLLYCLSSHNLTPINC